MEITLNGSIRSVVDNSTIADLLTELGLQPKFVAVERNKNLIPRATHAECRLAAGDSLEIVTLVGGG